MDIEKANLATRACALRDNFKTLVADMRDRVQKGPGITTITVPTAWLPEIIAIAERELDEINKEIEKL